MKYYVPPSEKVGGHVPRDPTKLRPKLLLLLSTNVPTTVVCRGLVMPGATASFYAPLPNSSIEQWRMVVIDTGYTLSVTSQYDVIVHFSNRCFGDVC